uniref:HVA22-like protein n=2 Tax=Aegilops tauschii subsp. strangulata TaxID=200361 RepID=A0A453HU84_AEGTS
QVDWKYWPLVALAYPLYASVKAIETKSSVDDQQWLTYWVLYSLITLFELTFTSIIEWLPFWSSMKLIFISWLVLPYFSGAAYVYQNYVRPVFVRNHMINIWYVPQKKGLFCNSDDFITALDKYIEENGPEALKKLADKFCTWGQSIVLMSGIVYCRLASHLHSLELWKGLKELKSLKEFKKAKASKDTKASKALKDSKEQKKAPKCSEEQKKALKNSKELKQSLEDWKELKKSLKDRKEQEGKDSNERQPKMSGKRVTFAEVEAEKEFKASNSNWHPTSDYGSAYPEHNSWNRSFIIFDDEHSYRN